VGATTLSPGQASGISIVYTVREVAGDQRFRYTIRSNDPASPEVELYLTIAVVIED
jgi:hypothetical protein